MDMGMTGRLRRTSRAAAVGLAVTLAALAAGGCAAPAKVIKAITSNTDQIKFLYEQGNSQGIIKCTVGAAGALSQCREMAVVLAE
jgi:hypothetical protein